MKGLKKPICPHCGVTAFITTRLWDPKRGWRLQYRCAICTKVLYTVDMYEKEVFKNGKLVESRHKPSNKVSSGKNVQ